MCTIVILKRVHPRYPVVVAANRDEFYARAARDPEVIARDPVAIAGIDVSSGGSWMGATADGVFVGLTNQRTYGGADKSLRSRGDVVREALELAHVDRIRDMLGRLDPAEFNPFNLVYGDAERVEVAYARRDAADIEIAGVPDGISVLPNDCLDSPIFPKVARARHIAAALGEGDPAELATVLADHELPSLDAVADPPDGSAVTRSFVHQLHALCIHTVAYGTRSSTIIAVEPGALAAYLYAPGPPCKTPFSDVTSLVAS